MMGEGAKKHLKVPVAAAPTFITKWGGVMIHHWAEIGLSYTLRSGLANGFQFGHQMFGLRSAIVFSLLFGTSQFTLKGNKKQTSRLISLDNTQCNLAFSSLWIFFLSLDSESIFCTKVSRDNSTLATWQFCTNCVTNSSSCLRGRRRRRPSR